MVILLFLVASFTELCLSAYTDPHCSGKQVIVHLFEWKWTDIALECERYLSKKGFCGVQVSPANEHVIVTNPMRPWWERYQPVSYKLHSRSGTETQFIDMVTRCKAVGVRIYVDVVINHMAGLGRTGTGTAGSSFDSDQRRFPGVPYSSTDFNRYCELNSYNDPHMIRDCYLVGLTDLAQSHEYVRNKIAGFLNSLIDAGVAGFRVDASKHMWPGDITAIQNKVKDLPEGGRPFFYHEVIDQNDGPIKVTEYYNNGRVTEFRYCQKIKEGIDGFGRLGGVVDYGWGMADDAHAFVFVDNHDNQRGHGGGGTIITHKHPKEYKMGTAFLLANDYGFTRVMSSYYFNGDADGPPHNADYSAKDVTINADGSCGNGWVCEHRWKPIGNMAAFRNAVAGTTKQHWYQQGDEVAFARGNKGFFAMAKNGHMDRTLQTGLPAGQYCNLIDDCATKITVDGSGNAHIIINNNEEPIVAFITAGIVVDNNNSTTISTVITSTTMTVPPGYARTVILIQKQTAVGQDLFIRGGLDHNSHSGCTQDAAASKCAIPIRHRPFGPDHHFDKVKAWGYHDSFLDWYGAEPLQGEYNGQKAEGTPAVWTTNKPVGAAHSGLNTYGDHYWLVDVDMDCSRTDNGWFELKAIVNTVWEGDIHQGTCSGSGGTGHRFGSNNHQARCGMMNVFHFDSSTCEIKPIP